MYVSLPYRYPKAQTAFIAYKRYEIRPEQIIAIHCKRWEVELLFKQIKQNFPLKDFYGKMLIPSRYRFLGTLIANLLPIVIKKGVTRSRFWNFFGLATMIKITLMLYIMWNSTVCSIIPKRIRKHS